MGYTVYRIDLTNFYAREVADCSYQSMYEAVKKASIMNRFSKRHDYDYAYIPMERKLAKRELIIPIFTDTQ